MAKMFDAAAERRLRDQLRRGRGTPAPPAAVPGATPAQPEARPVTPQTGTPAAPAAPAPIPVASQAQPTPAARRYTPQPAGAQRQEQRAQPAPPPPGPRPGPSTAPTGSQEEVDDARAAWEWHNRNVDYLGGVVRDRMGREYRKKTGPDGGILRDANGRPIVQLQWRQGPQGEWQDVAGNFGQQASDAYWDAEQIINRFPDFQTWMANQNGQWGQWRTLDDLREKVDRVTQGWGEGTLSTEAREQAALMLGFSDGAEMAKFQKEVRESIPEGIPGPGEGFTAEERADYERQHLGQIREMQAQAERDIDAIYGETGSSMRAMQLADGYRRQIGNQRLNHQAAMMTEDWARRQAEFDAKMQRAALLESQGIRGIELAANMIVQDRATAIQALSMQLSVAVTQNQQLQQLHQNDLQMLSAQASQMMALGDRYLGLDLAIQQQMDQLWERAVRPALAEYEMGMQRANQGLQLLQQTNQNRMRQLEIEAQERIAAEQAQAQRDAGIWGFFGSLFGALVGIGATFLTGGAAAPLIPALMWGGGAAGGRGLKLTP